MRRQDLKDLYELQQIDVQIAGAERARNALDDGTSSRQDIAKLEAYLKGLMDQLRALETEQRDAEMRLNTIETKKQSYQRRLYEGSVTNPKELEGMEKEIAMLGRNQDTVETRILELLDLVQAQRESVDKVQSRLTAKQADLEGKMSLYEQKTTELSEELARLTEERARTAQNVDEAALTRYDSVRKHMGGIAIGKVEDARCSACHVGLTPFALEAVKYDEEAPICESCGRYLYLPE